MKLSEQEMGKSAPSLKCGRPPIRAQAGAQKSMISTAQAAKEYLYSGVRDMWAGWLARRA